MSLKRGRRFPLRPAGIFSVGTALNLIGSWLAAVLVIVMAALTSHWWYWLRLSAVFALICLLTAVARWLVLGRVFRRRRARRVALVVLHVHQSPDGSQLRVLKREVAKPGREPEEKNDPGA